MHGWLHGFLTAGRLAPRVPQAGHRTDGKLLSVLVVCEKSLFYGQRNLSFLVALTLVTSSHFGVAMRDHFGSSCPVTSGWDPLIQLRTYSSFARFIKRYLGLGVKTPDSSDWRLPHTWFLAVGGSIRYWGFIALIWRSWFLQTYRTFMVTFFRHT